ncbi:MAG: phosphoribosylamine--glycine ligase [Deltaproteobacteria bacterium]|nr:phosphoribosylamine--glycine ligase [Deltaproteobacteria bacterium]
MDVLIIGGGGREHALAWKAKQSPLTGKLYIAPGNAGTAGIGENVAIKAEDIAGLKKFAVDNKIGLTIVGPEVPLTLGIVDEFEAAGLKIFGPSKRAAELEGSKVFSKELMTKYSIPTAHFKRFTDAEAAKAYAETLETHNVPLVVKADGLAAGKGVLICNTMDEAFLAIDLIMKDRAFGDAGNSVVIEDFLVGEEASFMAITDGTTILPLAPAQDHKAIYDNDKGPNTGGMGAYSPAPVITKELQAEVMEDVMEPMVAAMAKEGRPYKGILYAGLMICHGKPYVLEFNCRFGDPETQPVLMRLKTDIVELMLSCIDKKLYNVKLDWDERFALCVVMASEGYPDEYEKGFEITGLESVKAADNAVVFHAGTALKDGKVVTSGGRVLGVTGLGADVKDAIKTAYKAVEKIEFKGAYYRRDIGAKALIK